ncbi:unnamed protein product [Jaminaea pallidilutea]
MRCDSINLVPFNVSKSWIGRDERVRTSSVPRSSRGRDGFRVSADTTSGLNIGPSSAATSTTTSLSLLRESPIRRGSSTLMMLRGAH